MIMSKLEMIMRNKFTIKEFSELGSLEDCIKKVAIDYADWYAKKCLEIAYEEVKYHRLAHGEIQIDKDSILNITLPNHNDL